MRRASGCLIVLALAAGCEAPGARRTARAGAADSSVQIMIGATTTLTTNGSRKGHVTADSAFVYQRALRIDFRRMRVTLFAPQGEQIASLSAPRGLYAIEGGTLDASGGVVVVTAAGDSLTTPSLTYDKTKLLFRTDSAYVYKSRTGVRTGSGFTSDLELRNLRSGRGGT